VGEEIDLVIMAVLLMLLGVVAYRTDAGFKLLGGIDALEKTKAGSAILSLTGFKSMRKLGKAIQRKFNFEYFKKKSKEDFEDKFEE
jgi:hypothetical protein